MSARLELILGGARSGKSRLAEKRVLDSQLKKVYVATATPDDEEMAARIQRHRQQRNDTTGIDKWRVTEEPVHLADALESVHGNNTCALVDCLTLWISNCLHLECWERERDRFFAVLPKLSGTIIFVSNEVGMGIVPMGKITRDFVDASGLLHQDLTEYCQRVTLTVSGIPVDLKSDRTTIQGDV